MKFVRCIVAFLFLITLSNSFAQSETFLNTYALLNETDSGFVIEENCWSMMPDLMTFSNSENPETASPYFLTFDSFHSVQYNIKRFEVSANQTKMTLTGVDENELEENEIKEYIFELSKVSDYIVELYYENSVSYYVDIDHLDGIEIIFCKDEQEYSDADLEFIKYQHEEEIVYNVQDLIEPLLKLKTGSLNDFIGPNGCQFVHDGMENITDMHSDSLAEILNTDAYTVFLETVSSDLMEKLQYTFVDELPRCNDKDISEMVYIKESVQRGSDSLIILLFPSFDKKPSHGLLLETIYGRDNLIVIRMETLDCMHQ